MLKIINKKLFNKKNYKIINLDIKKGILLIMWTFGFYERLN